MLTETTNPVLMIEESSDSIFSESDFPILRRFTLDPLTTKIMKRKDRRLAKIEPHGITVNLDGSIDIVISESFDVGTKLELVKPNFAYFGMPFIYVPAKSTIDLSTLNTAYQARPFVSYARG